MREPLKLSRPLEQNSIPTGAKVLCYSPYVYWKMTIMKEMTILKALQLRGADVHYVLCNGVFSDCDIYLSCVNPRLPDHRCAKCQAIGTSLAYEMGLDFEWLGVYLNKEDYQSARAWVDGLADADLLTARYQDWQLGDWVESSAHTDLRKNKLDFSDVKVVQKYRGLLYSGLLAAFALERLIDQDRPDVLLAFNGRMSSLRIGMELARRRGIRVIVYENGLSVGELRLFENTDCLSMQEVENVWKAWGDLPLKPEEVRAIDELMDHRQRGSRMELKFSPPPQNPDEIFTRLNLDRQKPLWLLLTSSDDELIAAKDLQGPLTQREWMLKTLDYAAAHPEINLVIRVHPNTAGKNTVRGSNLDQLREMQSFQARLPANARMVMPEDAVSTYTLMDMCTAGLVYCSITGLELACKGKPVVAAAGGYITNKPMCVTLTDGSDYPKILDQLLPLPVGGAQVEIRKLANRLAYGVFFRWQIPFAFVAGPNADNCWLQYHQLDALLPGTDAALDRICDILLKGEKIIPSPRPGDQPGAEAEDACYRPAAVSATKVEPQPVKAGLQARPDYSAGLRAIENEEWQQAFMRFWETASAFPDDTELQKKLQPVMRTVHALAAGRKITYTAHQAELDLGLSAREPALKGAGEEKKLSKPAKKAAVEKKPDVDLAELLKKEDTGAIHQYIRYRWAEAVIDQYRPKRIIDLAMGDGKEIFRIASSHPDIEVVGLEVNSHAVWQAKADYPLKNLKFIQGSAEKWTFGVFDAVICFNAFEKLTRREIALQNLANNIEPNRGMLLFSTPCSLAAGDRVDYTPGMLLDLLQRYFRSILRPEDNSLPFIDLFDAVNAGRIRYSLVMNPLICQGPVTYA